MTLDEIKELLEHLKNEISKYEFDIDENFIMNSRRKILKSNIEETSSYSFIISFPSFVIYFISLSFKIKPL